jgi:hypothetical protein
MAKLSCLVGIFWIICAAPPALGEDLTVQNASFEDTVLTAGAATLNGEGLDHWTTEPGESVGLWNVSNLLDYPSGAPDGVNVAYSGGPAISQVLADVVEEGKTYILTVKVGNSPCCDFPGYGVQLLASGVVLAEDTNYIPVPPGTFESVVLTYTSPTGDENAGNLLEIRLLSLGPEVAFDAVSLTATADAFPDWEPMDINSAISGYSHNMVYDSVREVIVMFGGRNIVPFDDTWEFDGTSWSLVTTANSPPARFWHSMVFDSNRQRIVLFGGGDPDNAIYLNDTWEYDGTDWQQITTSHSPPQMLVRTMAFDSGRNRTVLVGGSGPGGRYNDTWEYDGSDWKLVTTPVSPPAPDVLAAMAYDTGRGRTVLTFEDGSLHLATWEYDGSTWTEVDTPTSPLGRWGHSMVYDSFNQHVMLFGGYSPHYASGSSLNDTWKYDGNVWTRIVTPHTPPPGDQQAMSPGTIDGRIVLLNWGATWVYRHTAICEPFLDLGCPPNASPQSFIDGLDVQINGGVGAPEPCEPVIRLSWDWGDGSVTDSFFPAFHTYPERDYFTITVTARDAGDNVLVTESCTVSLQVIFRSGFE